MIFIPLVNTTSKTGRLTLEFYQISVYSSGVSRELLHVKNSEFQNNKDIHIYSMAYKI